MPIFIKWAIMIPVETKPGPLDEKMVRLKTGLDAPTQYVGFVSKDHIWRLGEQDCIVGDIKKAGPVTLQVKTLVDLIDTSSGFVYLSTPWAERHCVLFPGPHQHGSSLTALPTHLVFP